MNKRPQRKRFSASVSAGQRDGMPFSVWDNHGKKTVSHHKTGADAMREAQRLNREEADRG